VHASPITNVSGTPDAAVAPPGVRFLRAVLAAQVLLGLLWGISMLFFASAIALGDRSGPHIEKIAIEGGAHLTLVLGAILVWRFPREARLALLLMIFLNAIWAVTDLVYIPLFALTAIDFAVKLIVNAALAVGLLVAGRRARIIFN
jgi:hypothetical protein